MHNKCLSIIASFSKMSFGIYLIHIFIMRDIVWNIDAVRVFPAFVQLGLITVVTLLLSFVISWAISKLPFSKYIIGL